MWGTLPPPGEATSCGRRPPGPCPPTGPNFGPSGPLEGPQVGAGTLVVEGVSPTESLPLMPGSHAPPTRRPQTGPQRV